MGPRGSRTLVRSFDVNCNNKIPICVFHVLEGDVAQDTGIVEEDIDSAEGLNGGLDDSVTIFDAVVVGYCFAACGLNLIDDDICSLFLLASSCSQGERNVPLLTCPRP